MALLLALMLREPSSAGVNRWTSNGPHGGGGIIVVDPRDANHVYVANPGVFSIGDPPISESRDGGLHWTPASAGLATGYVRGLLIDPKRPDVLYATLNQTLIYRSADAGRSWSLTPSPTGSSETTLVNLLALDPADGDRLYAYGTDTWRSDDGGRSWVTINQGLPQYSRFESIAADAHASGTVYAGGQGLYKSLDFGGRWFQSDSGLSGQTVVSLAIDPQSSATVFAATGSGIYRTRDGGATWEPSGLAGIQCSVVQFDPTNPQVLYAGSEDGLYRSRDGGLHWQRLDIGGGGSPYVFSIGVGSDSRTVYASPAIGLVRSSDGGDHWTGVSRGLPRASVFALAAPANSDGTDFYASGASVFRTRDGGRTWSDPGNAGLSSYLTDLVVDPRNPETLFGSGVGVFRSTDGGASWSSRGLDDLIVYRLALDPHRADTLYAGISPNTPTAPSGIRRSFDGGRTWVDASDGLPTDALVRDFAFDPTTQGTLFAAVSSFVGTNAVFRSTNSGGFWSPVLEAPIVSLASAPGDPDVLYAGGLGVWRSHDGGETWQHVDIGLYGYVTAVAVDPVNPAVLYAAADNPGKTIVRSLDAGESWRPFSGGFDSTSLFDLLVSPSGKAVHAAGSGVFDRTIASEAVTLPAVASLHGIPPTYFHSDVSVFNTSTSQASVVATYRCLGGSCPPVRKEFTIPARQVRLFQDMVATFFLQPDSGGAVEFESAAPLVVTSRLYSPSYPAPTLGMFVPGLPVDEAFPSAVLTSLSHSADRSTGFRTNVGVYNGNDSAQQVRFRFFDAEGNAVGELDRSVPARQALQINDVDLPLADGVDLETFVCRVDGDGESPLYAYAAVIDNQSQDSIFVPGRSAEPAEQSLVIPAAASLHGVGGTFFHSDVAVYNSSEHDTQVAATYRCTIGGCPTVEKSFLLGAGQVAAYDDIVGSLFESPETAGVVELLNSGAGRIVATSRLYTPSRPEPTVGMFVPGLDRLASATSLVLTSLSQSADATHGSRTNFGIVNAYPFGQAVAVKIFSGEGQLLGKVTWFVEGNASVQINDLFAAAGVQGDVPSAYCVVLAEQNGPLYAYAAVIDNQSQDPIFVPGQIDLSPPR